MISSDAPLTIEPYLTVKPGHRISFSPRDAVGGARGLRKIIRGVVSRIDTQGRACVGDWIIPLSKVQRTGSGAYREFTKAARKAERAEVYGGLAPEQKRALETCAKDARAAFLSTSKWSGPLDKSFLAETKRQREKFMRERGIRDFTDKGQCSALPLFLERALSKGAVPKLVGVSYKSADSGSIGVGDSISLAGEKFKITGYTPDGKLRLEDGHIIAVPSEYVPIDAGTSLTPVFKKLEAKRKLRLTKMGVKPRPRPAEKLSVKALFRRQRQQQRFPRVPRLPKRSRYRRALMQIAAVFRLMRKNHQRLQTLLCRDRLGRFAACGPLSYRRFKRSCFAAPSSRGRRTHGPNFLRDRRVRRNPRARIVIDKDLLSREHARLQQTRESGQLEIPFNNPPRARRSPSGVWPWALALGGLAFWLSKRNG